ncbi:Hypothetical predicted protein [Paramuricea clavata]|uniref:Uncharacterized protein n=1 Tax=Paramuricea clavata TaxID=317549 RepID=A0A7D9IXY0_PARCT|nr:Hypothetical predicted protein [Paramuricea clavata]
MSSENEEAVGEESISSNTWSRSRIANRTLGQDEKDINIWYNGCMNRYHDRKNEERRLSSARSAISSRTNTRRSYASTALSRQSSVKERLSQREEAKLKVQALEDKQRIERQIEEEQYEIERRKLEFEREIECKKSELNIISAGKNTASPTQGSSSTTKTAGTSGQYNTIAVGGIDCPTSSDIDQNKKPSSLRFSFHQTEHPTPC